MWIKRLYWYYWLISMDTLDTALAALENIRISNRTIGIIPHIDALKQLNNAQCGSKKAVTDTERSPSPLVR